ncbi:hypothetical protein TCAL_14361 [Tigriopus californicus]|uniref:Telomeric repeat-binding factor 2-interacting protein 1 n=1 Tax=Tigriopus californicus TaxID=6832 RepID=A0A553NEU7_TIGCA|nr:hypothetical protein TCAL_14361 [Tigriopus californicus]
MSQDRPDYLGPTVPVTLMTLFTRPVVLPCAFAMSASPTRALVRNLIQKHGGTLYDPRMSDQADHRIRLSEPGKLVLGQDTDIFDHRFIKACVDAGRILPNMSDFRMNQPSFFEDYDPLDILMGRSKWSDLVRAPNPGSDQGEEGRNDRSFLREMEQKRSEIHNHGGRQTYTRQDQQAILDYIKLQKRYSNVKGRQLWVQMEIDRVCGGHHSWQSMKEHFRKQIMPQIQNFQLKQSQIIRFRRAMDGDVVNDDESEELEDEPDQDPDKEQNQNENQVTVTEISQTKNQFTHEEEQFMVYYIVKNKKYSQLKRDSLWREMKKANLCWNSHAWRAMKRHFLEEIVPRIEIYDLASPQIARFRRAKQRDWVIGSEDEETEETRNESVQPEGGIRPPDIEQAHPERDARESDETESADSSKAKSKMRPRQTQNSEGQTTMQSINVACGSAGTTKNQEVSLSQRKSQENANHNTRSKGKRQKLFDNKTPTFDEFESGVILAGTTNPRRSSPVKSSSGLSKSVSRQSARISTARGNVDPQSSVSSHGSSNSYTKEEDQKLIDFVANHGLYDRRNGRSIWVALERRDLLPGRTWQSMKTRYIKYIEPKYKRADLKKADPKKVNLDESRAIQNQAGHFFTRNEDQKIIDFIVENRRFGEVGGNTLWKLMEARNILPDRTSQSMKERFRKRIMPNLHLFDIEPADRLRFGK